jgi:hypothetical protein
MKPIAVCLSLVIAMTTSAALAELANENLLTKMPDGYKLDFHQENKDMFLNEFVPVSQSFNNWTEMVTVQVFYGLKESPEQFKAKTEASLPKLCPGAKVNLITQGNENGYPFILFLQDCPLNKATGKPEITWFKVIGGNDSLYVVQFAAKAWPSNEEITNWLHYLRDVVVCDTRLPDRSCQAASAGATVTDSTTLAAASAPIASPRAEQAQGQMPSYIEAERSQPEQALGTTLTNDVFSDRFTALRKQMIAASLRVNPAAGCAEPPAFTLETVAPVEATPEGSAWAERYRIKCKQDVRRTFLLFASGRDEPKAVEAVPGRTIADFTLQRDVLQGIAAATISRAPARCKGVQVRDTRVESATDISKRWTEVWTLDACGSAIDVEVKFTPSTGGGTDWTIKAVK